LSQKRRLVVKNILFSQNFGHVYKSSAVAQWLRCCATNRKVAGSIPAGVSVLIVQGTAVAQWLRCCATNRKVASSIPVGVSGFFIDIKYFRSHYGPGVDSASNRYEYQEHFVEVKAAGA